MLFGKLLSGLGVVVTVGVGASASAAPTGTPPQGKAQVDKVKVLKKDVLLTTAGEPQWQAAKGPGAWLWTDAAGAHLRFSDPTAGHHLSAHVCAEKVTAVKGVGTEDGDKVSTTKKGDCAMARLTSDATPDGIDLAATGGRATVELVLDGKPMKADLIHVGQSGASPTRAKFAASL